MQENSQKELFSLGINQIEQILKAHLTIQQVYLFEGFVNGTDLTMHIDSKVLLSDKQTLIRKGFLTEDGKVTALGVSVYNSILNEQDAAKIIKEATRKIETDFIKWWAIYPRTDKWKSGAKEFFGTRGLRVSPEKCKEYFEKMVSKGEYTAEQIIEATKIDIETRRNASIKTGTNKLTFLQNSATYLNQKSFDPFVEEIGKDQKSETEFKGTSI